MWHKIKRLQASLQKEKDPNYREQIKAIIVGMTNYYTRSKKVTELARRRYKESCKGCPYFKTDPIESERIKDNDIPEIDGKMCYLCGCTLPYKLRQSIKKCEHWKS